jgi:hypothetical protein
MLVEVDLVGQVAHVAVDARADIALACRLAQLFLVDPLAAADDRGQHLDARALGHREHGVDDLLDRLGGDRLAAVVAVRMTDPREQEAQVAVDLGDGADGRARVAGGRLLLDGDRRRQALDRLDVGLLHLLEELARVGRQRLDVAALPLGVQRVEGQRRLARAGDAGHHDQLVARERQVDALQVVLRGPADDDFVGCHGSREF